MILRLSAEQLRSIAAQLDAHAAMEAAGADHLATNTVISVNGRRLAYAHWWEDGEQYLAEIISFTPGTADPLDYHEADQP